MESLVMRSLLIVDSKQPTTVAIPWRSPCVTQRDLALLPAFEPRCVHPAAGTNSNTVEHRVRRCDSGSGSADPLPHKGSEAAVDSGVR